MSDNGGNGRVAAGDAIDVARGLVQQLAGRPPEVVSGIARSEDGGWTVCLDVVELSRVPPSTDLLATYEVTIDSDGELVDMSRARRYVRGQPDGE